tara:strand:- start:733 stop:993 length:261 start_codon:yes stop_codon:yes gene_type:complete
MKKNLTKLTISLFLFSFIMFISGLSIYHEYYGFLFFPLLIFALYLFFSKKKSNYEVNELQIKPKIAEEMAKKIISDAKKHRYDREL